MDRNRIKPLFIFCMPRSGSTLLQKVLMGHKSIGSFAEPQLILPFVYALKELGTVAEYSHYTCHRGMSDVIDNLPEGKATYYKYLKDLVLNVYQDLSDDSNIYFLDKSPNYFSIIPEINKIFPDAKFIFLFRNPLDIYASMLKTFSQNRFDRNFAGSYTQLKQGPKLLSEGYDLLKQKSIAINYEDFVQNPKKNVEKILKYLELEMDEKIFKNFPDQDIVGRLGDPTGVIKYNSVSNRSINGWEQTFNTLYRKKVAKQYINSLDDKIFLTEGYDKNKILKEIDHIDSNGKTSSLMDLFNFSLLKFGMLLNMNLLVGKKSKYHRNYFYD